MAFGGKYQKGSNEVELETLIEFISRRIEALSHGLNPDVFNVFAGRRPSNHDFMGDGGLLGGLLFDALIAEVFVQCADATLEAVDMGNGEGDTISQYFNGAVVAAFDGVSFLIDEKANAAKGRVYTPFYPKGRNKANPQDAKKKKNQFNVAANQNFASSGRLEDELAGLYSILDMLEDLNATQIKTIRFDAKEKASKTITRLHKVSRKGGLSLMTSGLRRAI